MTTFMTWLPFLIGLLILVLYILAIKKIILKITRRVSQFGYGFLVMFITAIVLLFIWRAFYLEATPTTDWEIEAENTNTAIIFGFGYKENCKGEMLPDTANKTLYMQAINDANFHYLIMQDGVLVAACKADSLRNIRMHPHSPTIHINTIEAAQYAILKMDSLHVKKAMVYAHSQQLARAVFDLKRVAASNPKWHDFEFITPAIPPTPYPRQSKQRYTRYEITYVPLELLFMRPRDTLYPLCLLNKISLTY